MRPSRGQALLEKSRRAGRAIATLAALLLMLALAGCGEDKVAAEDTLPERPKLTVPDASVDTSADADKEEESDDDSGSTDSTGDGTAGGGQSGGTAPQDQTGGAAPPSTGGGGQAEPENTGGANAGVRYEQFCAENAGACTN